MRDSAVANRNKPGTFSDPFGRGGNRLHGNRDDGRDRVRGGITIGRHGDRYSGVLHLGAGGIAASISRHPDRDGHHGHGRHGHHDRYHYYGNRHDYNHGHYYHGYVGIDRRPRFFGHRFGYYPAYSHYGYSYAWYPWFGYSYRCAYTSAPIVYYVDDPEVIYVDRTTYVEVEPEEPYAYGDGGYVDDSYASSSDAYGSRPVGTSVSYDRPNSGLLSANSYISPDEFVGPPTPMSEYDKISPNGNPVLVGNAAFARGDYTKAQSAFAGAVLADERDGYLKLLYGAASIAAGEYSLGGVAIRRALLTTDLLIDQPLDLRSLYSNEAEFEYHLRSLDDYVATYPADRDATFALGYVLYATGDPDRATKVFRKLSQRDTTDLLAEQLLFAAESAQVPVLEQQ